MLVYLKYNIEKILKYVCIYIVFIWEQQQQHTVNKYIIYFICKIIKTFQ